MSLKITEKNKSMVGLAFSASDWARLAIGGDKKSGKKGFEDYKSGEWSHSLHYKYINNTRPTRLPYEGDYNALIEEMASVRESMVEDIMSLASDLDHAVMRLQRMEEQIKNQIEAHALEE